MVIAVYWEVVHPNRKEDWFYLLEMIVLKFSTMYTLMALFLFVLCGQLFVIYHLKIIEDLRLLLNSKVIHHDSERSSDELIWSLLSHLRILCEAKRQLFRDFRPILMMNYCLSVVNILTCSYYSINHFFTSNYWVVVMWDICDTLEFIFRLWVLCHTADQIRSSVCVDLKSFLFFFAN